MTAEEFKKNYLPLEGYFNAVAFSILSDSDLSRDAVQDLYVKLWNIRDRLDSVANHKAYASTLLRNRCIDRLRRTNAHPDCPMTESAGSIESPERELIGRERLKIALDAIEGLPERQKEVVRMRVFEGLEYDEIERRTGLAQTSLRVLLSTARKTVRQKMGL